ncbi:hypothetical protein BGZ97_009686, partial [Linnemannia gamsii]
MLNTGIVNLSRPNHSFSLRIMDQNPSEVASNRPVPDPPPTSLPLDHRGPIFFQFLSDHFEANVYVFTSLGKAQKFTPRYPCETTRSVAFLKAADHVQTVVEYLVLGFAIHATPRREPADRTSLATFMDTEHPTPAVYREHSRPHGGKGKKRDPEWRDLQKSVLISVYEDHCKDFIDTEILKHISALQKMKAKANSIPQQVKDTELATLTTKWLARTRSPIAFKRFVTAVRLEVRMPQLTEDMVREKIGSNVVDIWRQVVRDHLQPRWCQVMEDVIVGSKYDANRGGQTRPGAVAHVSTSSTPLFGGSTSYLQERTVESGTGVASGCMDLDEDQSSDEEEEEQADDDDYYEDGSRQYRAVTTTLSQILRPDLQEDLDHIVDALHSRQDTMTDLMSNAAVMGQKIVLL